MTAPRHSGKLQHPARWVALGVAIVVAAFGIVLATQVSTDPTAAATKSELVGKPAPDYSLTTFDGREVSASSLSGKAVIVNFWNSWCTPCQHELPELKAFYAEHAGEADFAMVGIVRDDTRKAARGLRDLRGHAVAVDPRPVRRRRAGLRDARPARDVRHQSGRGGRRCPHRPGDDALARHDARGGAAGRLEGVVARRWLPWLLLGVVVIGAITWAAWPGGSTTPAERAHDLATQLKCPDCEGLSVADSNTSSAGAIRADIRKRIARGESPTPRSARPTSTSTASRSCSRRRARGSGLLVWGLPVAAIVLGAGGLVIALRRWQRQPRLHATDADVALVEGARDRTAP